MKRFAIPTVFPSAGVRVLAVLGALVSSAGAFAGAVAQVPAPDRQVEEAVQPLPSELRDGATVLGYRSGEDGRVTLREGEGEMTCLADDPADDRWHVACYHRSLEPFMARGRELRAQGLEDEAVDSARRAEAEAGELPMPDQGAALYSLTGPPGSYDAQTEQVSEEARPLFVLYMPWATAESTGLSGQPEPGEPWLMDPGLPWAHIMLTEPPRDDRGGGTDRR